MYVHRIESFEDASYPIQVFLLQLFVLEAAPPLDTDRVWNRNWPDCTIHRIEIIRMLVTPNTHFRASTVCSSSRAAS